MHEALDTRAYRIEKRPFMATCAYQKGDDVLIFLCSNRLVATMRVLTGDETGLLKAVDVEAMRIVVLGQQTRKKAIKAMAWTGTEPGAFAVARADSVVTLWQDGKVSNCSLNSPFGPPSVQVGIAVLKLSTIEALLVISPIDWSSVCATRPGAAQGAGAWQGGGRRGGGHVQREQLLATAGTQRRQDGGTPHIPPIP